MTRRELTNEALSLPVEERAILADALLRSLNAPDSEVERRWADVARRRLGDIRAGTVRPVPGDEVFARIRNRFKA